MMRKTHLALIIFLILIFVPYVNNKILFSIFAFFAALLPDIDSEYSAVGRHWFLRPLQFFIKHRGILHSLSFCILISILLSLFLPVLAFPVFLGYSTHLLFDSITLEGIQPFWPLKKRSDGFIKTNSHTEEAIFFTLVFVNFLIVLSRILKTL
ncbi:MAG: metal-dependent hydrolase [Candidatus Pacearchaeota archaeon]